MTVTVVGVDGTSLAPGARHALGKATLVLGERRFLDAHAPRGVRTADLEPLPAALAALADEHGDDRSAVLLVSGDPGFFGIVDTLRDNGIRARVLPAVSAVQRLAALLGRGWDELTVLAASARDLRPVLNVCRARPAVAVLTASGAGPTELGAGLAGWRRTLVIAEEIGTPRESLSTVDAEQAAGRLWREPNVVFAFAEHQPEPESRWHAGGEPHPPAGGWALDADAFAYREGELAGPAVRALALARLAPRPGTLVWDVGAGPGAVAVECARLGAAVVAVDADPGQNVRVMANAARHGVDVRVVDGAAPDALAGLPVPDSAWVGGGGPPVLAAVAASGARRIVVPVEDVSLLAGYRELLQGNGFQVSGCQLGVASLHGHGDGGIRVGAADQGFLLWGVAS